MTVDVDAIRRLAAAAKNPSRGRRVAEAISTGGMALVFQPQPLVTLPAEQVLEACDELDRCRQLLARAEQALAAVADLPDGPTPAAAMIAARSGAQAALADLRAAADERNEQ